MDEIPVQLLRRAEWLAMSLALNRYQHHQQVLNLSPNWGVFLVEGKDAIRTRQPTLSAARNWPGE